MTCQNMLRYSLSILKMLSFLTRSLMTTPFFVFSAVSFPISFCALSFMGTGNLFSERLWVLTCMAGVWASTITATGIIGYQRFQGTLEYLLLSPLPEWLVFYSVMLSATGIGVALGIPLSMLISIVFSVTPLFSIETILGFILVVASCSSLAPILAILPLHSRDSSAFEPILLLFIWLLSGAITPLDELPSILRAIAMASPLSSAVMVCFSPSISDAVAPALLCVCLCLGYLFAGSLFLKHIIRNSRISGSLSLS